MPSNQPIKQNYQAMLDKILATECQERRPSLLLHACCAPCSSYVLEYLAPHFEITLFFYNPNISPAEEHRKREEELRRLVDEMGLSERVKIIVGDYEPERFEELAKGREALPEGGARCRDCYRLRLAKTAKLAAELGFDYFTTTLSISPHKRADWLNEIGAEEAEANGTNYLPSDFKKKNGYRRSCELSVEYGLYRQNYCGCVYSKKE
ncbi:MAG: epoxyqueuosine reductase QueH [Clostridia bacterium]|nr:epoxyqueuosine reductase QueH [Clostridia bacterium]